MAGSFPDVPGFRFEYDRDGSVMQASGGTVSVTSMQYLNDESSSGADMGTGYTGIAWPEIRTVTGLFLYGQHGVNYNDQATIKTSPNTTNGYDGTWTTVGTLQENINATDFNIPTYCRQIVPDTTTRNGISLWNLPNITGIQIYPVYQGGWTAKAIHIYGTIPLTSNPSRLVLCDSSGTPTTNGAYFDFGNAARATAASIPFRIKNNSSVSTAQSITVAMQALYDSSPTFSSNHDFDFGGGWVKTANIGDLGPGAITPVYQFRRNTPAGAAVGPWQGRVTAVPAFMT